MTIAAGRIGEKRQGKIIEMFSCVHAADAIVASAFVRLAGVRLSTTA
jgi:hypothetical protein